MDPVERYAVQEQPGCDAGCEAQMMTLQTLVVGQDLVRRQEKSRAPERAVSRVSIEQHGRQADAKRPKPFTQLPPDRPWGSRAELFGFHGKMPAPRLQLLDLFEHLCGQQRIAREKRHDNRLGFFFEDSKQELLERGPQRNSIVVTSPVVWSLASGLP